VSGARLEHAVAAFLRQEFGASVAAIIGFLDILIEDARRDELTDIIPDLDRMREAGAQLSALTAQAAASWHGGEAETARLRHELRTPLNAIKGYGELLVEEAQDHGRDTLLDDLQKVLDLAGRLLGEIDCLGGTAAVPPIDIVGTVLQTIKPLGEMDLSADANAIGSRILIVDDNASNRDLLARRLAREGHRVELAESGAAALALTAARGFDLVLLDLMMPAMSGFEVLCRLKASTGTRHIPVIMISALDELDSTVRCIEAGAEDYLSKPFNPVLLRARITACLQKKRLLDELSAEKERSEALLLNVLPRSIIERMRRGETSIADRIAEATILFADIVDFTSLCAKLSPEETVRLLGLLFSQFEDLAVRHGLETIKTIGDGYMVTGGILEQQPNSAAAVADMAFSMLEIAELTGRVIDTKVQLRIGMHTGGPIVAGVLGTHKIAYDVWGDTVNTAKRMESYGAPGHVHVSAETRRLLGDAFRVEPCGLLDVKGKGSMETYFVYRRESD
jgi:class 3 adenylate cyclase